MHYTSNLPLAVLSKHDWAGIALAIVAAVLLALGGVRLAAKAVKLTISLVLCGAVAVVLAILLFTRAV